MAAQPRLFHRGLTLLLKQAVQLFSKVFHMGLRLLSSTRIRSREALAAVALSGNFSAHERSVACLSSLW